MPLFQVEILFVGGNDGLDDRTAKAALFQGANALDGGAAGGADGVFELSGVPAALQRQGRRAQEHLGGQFHGHGAGQAAGHSPGLLLGGVEPPHRDAQGGPSGDVATLDELYKLNLTYFKELSMYILAGKKRLAEVRRTTLEELKAASDLFEADVYDALNLENCMALRASYGGPAVEQTSMQIAAIETLLMKQDYFGEK